MRDDGALNAFTVVKGEGLGRRLRVRHRGQERFISASGVIGIACAPCIGALRFSHVGGGLLGRVRALSLRFSAGDKAQGNEGEGDQCR